MVLHKRSTEPTTQIPQDEKAAVAKPGEKKKMRHMLVVGDDVYDPASDPFWYFLGGLMVVGAVLHMRRVYSGWVDWNECTEGKTGDFADLFKECWNYTNKGKKSEGSLWKVFHFSGGVIWMFGGLVQLCLWHLSRFNPRLMKYHRMNGKMMAVNAIVLVAGVGCIPAFLEIYESFTLHCTVPAMVGGLPTIIGISLAKEYIPGLCHKEWAFMPHFLWWATTGVWALTTAIIKAAMDMKKDEARRMEHMAWGLFMAGFGCFDSVNYLVKHVFLYLDWFEDFELYHFIIVPTPFVFIVALIFKCRLHKMYRMQDIWASLLVFHCKAIFCKYWVPVRPEFMSRPIEQKAK